jgi:hypothetical protein
LIPSFENRKLLLILDSEKPEIMKCAYLFSLVLFLIANSVDAQLVISVNKKEFKTEKPGFDEAWRHVKKGNSYYSDKGVWYSNAFGEYQQAYTYNSVNPELNYKIGVSCLFSDKKEEASAFLIKAYELKKEVARDILLLTGRALMFDGKFKPAIEYFNNYVSSAGKKPKENITLAKKCIEECNAALIIEKDTLRVEINNIGGNINSAADDYSEVLASGGTKMLFASRRAMTDRARSTFTDTKFDENIFSSDLVNGSWSVAMLFDKNLVTKFCETPLYMNDAGNQLYIYAGYNGNGDIMVSELIRGKWRAPVPVKFKLNSQYPETSFTFSRKGDEIAFVSDRGKNGLGGKEIGRAHV